MADPSFFKTDDLSHSAKEMAADFRAEREKLNISLAKAHELSEISKKLIQKARALLSYKT